MFLICSNIYLDFNFFPCPTVRHSLTAQRGSGKLIRVLRPSHGKGHWAACWASPTPSTEDTPVCHLLADPAPTTTTTHAHTILSQGNKVLLKNSEWLFEKLKRLRKGQRNRRGACRTQKKRRPFSLDVTLACHPVSHLQMCEHWVSDMFSCHVTMIERNIELCFKVKTFCIINKVSIWRCLDGKISSKLLLKSWTYVSYNVDVVKEHEPFRGRDIKTSTARYPGHNMWCWR